MNGECPECSTEITEEKRFCPACGACLDDVATSSEPDESETEPESLIAVRSTSTTDTETDGSPANLIEEESLPSLKVAEYPTVAIETTVSSVKDVAMDRDDFTIIENGERIDAQSVSLSRPTLDFVVTFDDTGSMGNEIAAMQDGVKSLTDSITAQGIDARYALVSFKDDPEVKLRYTEDPQELKAAVDDLSASGGGDAPEDSFGAIEAALNLESRDDATTVCLHITDAPAHYRKYSSDDEKPLYSKVLDPLTGSSDYILEEVATDLREAEVDFITVSPDQDDEATSIKTLASRSGGFWTDISDEDFDDVLDQITSLLTSTYTIEYWTTVDPGDRSEVEVLYDHPQRGQGSDYCEVVVPEDAV